MRNVDERCAAVRNREKRLRRRRDGVTLAAIMCLTLIPLIDLVGRSASDGIILPFSSNEGLFGASLLFGPDAGGYVLVAVAAAAIAVEITALLMTRRHPSGKRDAQPDDSGEIIQTATGTSVDETNEGDLNG